MKKGKYSMIDRKGSVMASNLHLKTIYHLSGNSHPSNHAFIQLRERKFVFVNGMYYACLTGDENHVFNLLKDQAQKLSFELKSNLISNDSIILELSKDLAIVSIHNSIIKDIAELKNKAVGSIKSKINRDKKVIRKMISGDLPTWKNVSTDYRLIKLGDYLDIINEIKAQQLC